MRTEFKQTLMSCSFIVLGEHSEEARSCPSVQRHLAAPSQEKQTQLRFTQTARTVLSTSDWAQRGQVTVTSAQNKGWEIKNHMLEVLQHKPRKLYQEYKSIKDVYCSLRIV